MDDERHLPETLPHGLAGPKNTVTHRRWTAGANPEAPGAIVSWCAASDRDWSSTGDIDAPNPRLRACRSFRSPQHQRPRKSAGLFTQPG